MHPPVVSVSAFSLCGASSESERSTGLPVTGRRSRESLSAARRGESDMASVQKIKLSPSRVDTTGPAILTEERYPIARVTDRAAA